MPSCQVAFGSALELDNPIRGQRLGPWKSGQRLPSPADSGCASSALALPVFTVLGRLDQRSAFCRPFVPSLWLEIATHRLRPASPLRLLPSPGLVL